MDDHNAAGWNDSGTEGSNDPDNNDTCSTCGANTRRVGRGVAGNTFVDVVCANGHTVAHDVDVDRDRGVATDGGENVVLAPGDDAAWCPDCEDWVPCECDGIPAAVEIRPYEPNEGKRIATDGGEEISLEEFKRRQREWSSTDPDDQPECEECGSVVLVPKSEQDCGREREHEEPYRCQGCGEHVNGSGSTTSINGGASA